MPTSCQAAAYEPQVAGAVRCGQQGPALQQAAAVEQPAEARQRKEGQGQHQPARRAWTAPSGSGSARPPGPRSPRCSDRTPARCRSAPTGPPGRTAARPPPRRRAAPRPSSAGAGGAPARPGRAAWVVGPPAPGQRQRAEQHRERARELGPGLGGRLAEEQPQAAHQRADQQPQPVPRHRVRGAVGQQHVQRRPAVGAVTLPSAGASARRPWPAPRRGARTASGTTTTR